MPDVLKTVGRYEILREVGRGGMAMVYLARQTDLDRFVALKELAAFHASDAAFAQRFLRESRVAGSLSHPNIVTVHDYFEHDGTPYIAMEYVERGSLRPFVGQLSPAQIGGVLEGLLAGLAQAEQHGIVHRDLKPENLMVTSDGRVKIADFGIAKATTQMQTGAFLTATGTTVGTPTYMAPEQAMAQDIGPWTDLYSVGCMAFELFTGKVPFHDSDAPMAILLRHVNEEIPAVKSIVPSVDQGVSDWIEQLLVKDPKARTQSANEAWDEFEELIIGLLGPRWRRSARLSAAVAQVDTPKPLTPAPFEGTSAVEGASDEFQSFAWDQPAAKTPAPPAETPPGPATPPPVDAPAGPLEPGPIDVPTGPPTPPPLEPVADSGFVTFGAPAEAAPARRRPPHRRRETPVEEPAAAVESPAPEAPAQEPAAAVESPAAVDEPIIGAHGSGAAAPPDESAAEQGRAPAFETYNAPPPLRPPADEPAAPEPAAEPAAPEPAAEPAAAARHAGARARGGGRRRRGNGHAGGAQARARAAAAGAAGRPGAAPEASQDPQAARTGRARQPGVPDRAGLRPRAGCGRGLPARRLGRCRGRAGRSAGEAGRGRSRAAQGSRGLRGAGIGAGVARARPRGRGGLRAGRRGWRPRRQLRPGARRTTPRCCPSSSARRSGWRTARCPTAPPSSSVPTSSRHIATRDCSRRARTVA